MKHTPGPWLVDTIETAPEYTNNTDQLIRISFPKISINGHAEKTGEQLQQEYQQNERLIASAPDLLATLELVASSGPLNNGMKDENTMAEVREAIAKAKGE